MAAILAAVGVAILLGLFGLCFLFVAWEERL